MLAQNRTLTGGKMKDKPSSHKIRNTVYRDAFYDSGLRPGKLSIVATENNMTEENLRITLALARGYRRDGLSEEEIKEILLNKSREEFDNLWNVTRKNRVPIQAGEGVCSPVVTPALFDDSDENLQRIADTAPRPSNGTTRTPSGLPRKPSVQRERTELQDPGNEYARSKGVYVAVMNSEGFPDNLYVIPGMLPFGVEWKVPGKRQSPEQAQRFLDLRRLGWDVRVFDSLGSFKVWLDGRLSIEKAA
jgi:hypothetical protein